MAQAEHTGSRRAPSGAVEVTPSVIEWAIAESGMNTADLAVRVGVSEADVEAWTRGAAKPNRGEFTKLATALARPTAVFFLPTPPDGSDIPPQFRTFGRALDPTLGPNELLAIREASRLQSLVSWILKDEGHRSEMLTSLPSTPMGDPIADFASALRTWLGVSIDQQLGWTSPAEAFRSWRSALERNGVIVTQRSFGRDSIRGFSLADEWAPLIVVNRSEIPQARSFTLLHELAHLASEPGSSCVLPSDYDGDAKHRERWCDRVASHVLVPRDVVDSEIRALARGQSLTPFALVERAARRFKVSLRAAAVALMDRGHAPPNTFAVVKQHAPVSDYPPPPTDADQLVGPMETTAVKRLREVGPLALESLIRASKRDRITLHDVFDYLDINSIEFDELQREMN